MESSTNAKPIQSEGGERDEALNDIRQQHDHNIENLKSKKDSGPHQEVGEAAGPSAGKTSVRLDKPILEYADLNLAGRDVNTFEKGVPVRVDDSTGGGNQLKTLITDANMTGGTITIAGRDIKTIGTKK